MNYLLDYLLSHDLLLAWSVSVFYICYISVLRLRKLAVTHSE